MEGRRIAVIAERQAVIESFDVPTELGPGEVLVRVAYSLISPGTELGAYNAPTRRQPFHPGYTAVGEVLEVGSAWDRAMIGATVFVFPDRADSVGCHATHKRLAPGGLVLPLPAGLDPATACFARMINIALTPYVLVDPKLHGTVLVIGLGLVGNVIAQVGRLRGWRVLGADPDPRRRERALECGVSALIDPSEGDLATAVRALTEGSGADLTINATGHAGVFPAAIEATADGGEVSTLGGARHGAMVDLREVFGPLHSRHITIRGGWELSLPRYESPAAKVASTERNLRTAFRWLADGAVRLKPLWTHTIGPEEFPSAYDALNERDPAYLGVVVDWAS